jgi:hypothetical protein
MESDKILFTVSFTLLGLLLAFFARTLMEGLYRLVDWVLGEGYAAWWVPKRDPASRQAQVRIIRVFGGVFAGVAAAILVIALATAPGGR